MSNLFKTPKMPTPQQVAPEVVEAQKRQEERLQAQEEAQMRQIAARKRARRSGGMRMLLSKERENAQTGVKSTLGS
jgi:hypothetical protein